MFAATYTLISSCIATAVCNYIRSLYNMLTIRSGREPLCTVVAVSLPVPTVKAHDLSLTLLGPWVNMHSCGL